MAESYEAQREANIRRNQELLRNLGLREAATAVVPKRSAAPKTPKARREPHKVAAPAPARASPRLRGLPPTPLEDQDTAARADGPTDEDLAGGLLTAEEFFTSDVLARAIRVDGHYRGWLNPEVQQKYGLEASAEAAWQAHGGGTFSFKNPLGMLEGDDSDRDGSGSGAKKGGRRKARAEARPGWSSARELASKLFRKNPNAYFYRLLEPGVEQWTGDWTPEEKETFLKVAREFGCGDKWGLFSTYLPHRVGYQCSAYYRQVILPEGLVIDPNYLFTRNGYAVYNGSHMRGRRE